ncbi:MAG: hypothetical protein ACFB8W_19705 [Elainellaceae cyanobacterium]
MNERNLRTLSRIIQLTGGRRFALILARCNYESLRNQILLALKQICPVSIEQLWLTRTDQRLFTRIERECGKEPPTALHVLGLERVKDLDQLLLSTNQVRDEFRKQFKFPLIIWVTDQTLVHISRLVPDFHSWATPISFSLSTPELVTLLKANADLLFEHMFTAGLDYPASDRVLMPATNSPRLDELKLAKQELEQRNHPLDAYLQASLQLALGRDSYRHDRLNDAIESYQQSLRFWQQTHQHEREGMVLFHLALCHRRLADLNRLNNYTHLKEACECFKQCFEIFERVNRAETAASLIGQLGETLQRLSSWEELSALAERSLELHNRYPNPARLARDYGFMAEIAQEDGNWVKAHTHAQRALHVLNGAPESQQIRKGLYLLLLAQAQKELGEPNQAIATLEIAKAESNPQFDPLLFIRILDVLQELYFMQEKYTDAFEVKLERQAIHRQYGLRAFIGANRLRPRRKVSPIASNLSAQILVAPEIEVSDRQRDIERIIERISRPNYKLTVIHGPSGVGKSSMVHAGLIPILKDKIINSRDVLPILVNFYTNWIDNLCRSTTRALRERLEHPFPNLESIEDIIGQLRENEQRNLLSILIFDQFEEFFITYSKIRERQPFFAFLNTCLRLPYVKVFLVIREDYLHYLLEYERLPSNSYIGRDILNRENRYQIGNFSRRDAAAIIRSLTERTQFFLEPELIDVLVEDLARGIDEVRPIELQIVGAQLQAEKIETLVQYRDYDAGDGPKARLVQRYLEDVVNDCGPENRRAAELVLYLLTDENNTRPQKTRTEIEADLKALAQDLAEEASKLDLVLGIFVKSGLVFLLPELPASRYQLVHDYLVEFIRRQQEPKLKELSAQLKQVEQQRDRLAEVIAELETEKQQRVKTEEELEIAETRIQQAKRRIRLGTAIIGAAVAIATGMAWAIYSIYTEVRYRESGARLEREGWLALQKADSDPLDALITSMDLGKELRTLTEGRELLDYSAFSPMFALQQLLDRIQVVNQLIGHEGQVYDVDFSPDNQYIVTASEDTTARIWNFEGTQQMKLDGHNAPVWQVSFSPGGQIIATSALDGTVKLWNADGTLQNSFKVEATQTTPEQTDNPPNLEVFRIQFSSDGKQLLGASNQSARIWDLQSDQTVEIISRNPGEAQAIQFSPDGRYLFEADNTGTVRLRRIDLNQIIREEILEQTYSRPIQAISFSPDGRYLALGLENDLTAYVWNLEDRETFELRGHRGPVTAITFSPKTRYIVTSSRDATAILWDLEGNALETFRGHEGTVWATSFSPDEEYLATTSDDGKPRLWKLDSQAANIFKVDGIPARDASFNSDSSMIAAAAAGKVWLRDLQSQREWSFDAHHGQLLYSLAFSPNHQYIATASEDRTAKLWNYEGEMLQELYGHEGQVHKVIFHPSKDLLVTASADQTARLWNLEGEEIARFLGHQAPLWGLSFSSDGGYLATSSEDNTVRLWSLREMNSSLLKPNGPKVHTKSQLILEHDTPILSIDFHPNRSVLASASVDGHVKIWKTTGDLLYEFTAHEKAIFDIRFSQDGLSVATASDDGRSRIWSLNGNLLAEFAQHNQAVRSAEFSFGEDALLTVSEDGEIRLERVHKSLEDLMNASCDWLKFYIANPQVAKDDQLCSDSGSITKSFYF